MTVPVRSEQDAALPRPRLAWAFLLDVDGTLVDIDANPKRVQVASSARAIIDGLFAATGGAVALVSGRALSDFDYLYPHCGLPISGQHGLEWRNVEKPERERFDSVARLDPARELLAEAIMTRPGVLLEDKGFSIALHYRLAPGLATVCHRVMKSAQALVGEEYALQRGKRVIELKRADVNKGHAVRHLMSLPRFVGRVPVFVGDDVTDEDGFRAVNELDGISIKIGRGRTLARWHLDSIAELMRWLTTAE